MQGALAVIAVAGGQYRLDPKLFVWSGADHIDGAASRIAPIERALRAAQHFNPRQIRHIAGQTHTATDVNPIDIHANGRILSGLGIVVANAAHKDDQ